MKKQKKMDPEMAKSRETRKRKKLEREIRELQKTSKQEKSVTELVIDPKVQENIRLVLFGEVVRALKRRFRF
jgi:hypothetical protein